MESGMTCGATARGFVIAVSLLAWTAIDTARTGKERKTMVNKSTPILHVKSVEPSLKFWTERFGFRKTIEVPEGEKCGGAVPRGGKGLQAYGPVLIEAVMYARIVSAAGITGAPISGLLRGQSAPRRRLAVCHGVICSHQGYKFFMIALVDQEEVNCVVWEIKDC